ncbi:prenylated flavin chaperone LpdD [Paenibacillus sp. CMAA1364]
MMKFNPDDIQLKEIHVGRDVMLIITGGDAHIGAVSTAYPTPEGIDIQTSNIPGHKEYTITEALAQQAVEVLNRTVTVSAGIHYDDLTTAEIDAIVTIVQAKMDVYLKKMKRS